MPNLSWVTLIFSVNISGDKLDVNELLGVKPEQEYLVIETL